jgi:formylglycine-generating enzyme required for sulfatase activity
VSCHRLQLFFSDFPYEKQKWIKIAPSEAETLWNSGKEKPFFIQVNRLDDRSIIGNAILRIDKKLWSFGTKYVDYILIPEMVKIPDGSFRMGGNTVSMKSFYMGKYEITFAEYDQFAEATGRNKPDDEGWGRGNRPVIHVSMLDATAYAEWLSQQTGQTYRLPTAPEWEYANYGKDECCEGLAEGKDHWKYTSPVGSFAANPFGLYDTVGNVWEWTCSEYTDKYNDKEKQCPTSASRFVLRGGSWSIGPRYLRSAGQALTL